MYSLRLALYKELKKSGAKDDFAVGGGGGGGGAGGAIFDFYVFGLWLLVYTKVFQYEPACAGVGVSVTLDVFIHGI